MNALSITQKISTPQEIFFYYFSQSFSFGYSCVEKFNTKGESVRE